MENFFIKMEEETDRWGNSKTVKTIRKGRVVLCAILVLLLAITLFKSFTIVPTGYTGVRTTFGQIDANVVEPGFSFKIPYVQSIQKVNNKQQDILL